MEIANTYITEILLLSSNHSSDSWEMTYNSLHNIRPTDGILWIIVVFLSVLAELFSIADDNWSTYLFNLFIPFLCYLSKPCTFNFLKKTLFHIQFDATYKNIMENKIIMPELGTGESVMTVLHCKLKQKAMLWWVTLKMYCKRNVVVTL